MKIWIVYTMIFPMRLKMKVRRRIEGVLTLLNFGEVSWERTPKKINKRITKQINAEYSLKIQITRLKLSYFGHMQRASSFEKSLFTLTHLMLLDILVGKARVESLDQLQWDIRNLNPKITLAMDKIFFP